MDSFRQTSSADTAREERNVRLIDGDALALSYRELIIECQKWIDDAKAHNNEKMLTFAQQAMLTILECNMRLKRMPTIDPEPKKGKWRHFEGNLECDQCGSIFYDEIMDLCADRVPRFCPDCGADMRG